MHLFTWNLRGRHWMLPYAFAHLERLSRSDMLVAAFQEWPGALPDLGDYRLRVVPIEGKVVLLHSDDLRLVHHEIDRSGRATIARFQLPSGNELTCVGLHWYSRDSRTGIQDPAERGGAMALFRHHLDLILPADSPSVIMGDFNCSPDHHEREMCSPYCLFALTPRHRHTPGMKNVMGTTREPWTLLVAEAPARVGSYFWPRTQGWSVLDHFALTHHLAKTWYQAQVLTGLEGHDFLTPQKQVPMSNPEEASDHLPVICELHYQ